MESVEAASVAPVGKPVRNIDLRRAGANDLSALIEILRQYIDECALEGFPPIHEPDLLALVKAQIETAVVIVAECDDRIIATTSLDLVPFSWNAGVKFFWNMWFYVCPEFRKGGTALHLIAGCKEIADLNSMMLIISLFTRKNAELIGKLLQQHGFRFVGGNYVYSPKGT